jgi:hypothetical protein
VALLIQAPALVWGIPGGRAINNALRILDGDIPYRDFWTMYAPGHFYLVAGVFALFGTHVWVQAAAMQIIVAMDAAVLFAILRRIGLPRGHSAAVATAFVAMLWEVAPEMTTYEPALLPLLIALYQIVRYLAGAHRRTLVFAGALCGVGAWFKHDVAFHVAAGIGMGLTVAWWFARGHRPTNWVSPLRVAVRVGGSALLSILPVAVPIAIWAGPDAWRDLFVFPATVFPAVRGEHYPGVMPDLATVRLWVDAPTTVTYAVDAARHLSNWVIATLPEVVFVAGVVAIWRRGRELDPFSLGVVAVSLTTLPLFWLSAHVQQNTHLYSMSILCALFAAVWWVMSAEHSTLRRLVLAGFVLQTAALLAGPALLVARATYFWPTHVRLTHGPVSGVRVPRAEAEVDEGIVRFLRENIRQGERIYVGLARHDAIVTGNQSFYYLSGLRIASRYNELHPGVADREEVQREIVADLERERVRCAVLWEFGQPREVMDRILAKHRRTLPWIGATVLDDYLRREYHEIARYGEYRIVWRRGIPLPDHAIDEPYLFDHHD